MRKIYYISLFLISFIAQGQQFESFASGIKINSTIYNTSGNGINQINSDPGAQNLDGANLGVFGANSNCARITGGELKTWNTALGNVCSGNLNWRVYPLGSPSGSFNTISLSVVSDCNTGTSTFNDGFGPCSSNDKKWKNYLVNSNFINGLLPGNYTLEIYFDFTGSDVSSVTCETTKYVSNAGNNFKATFVISNPTSNPVVSSTTICEGDNLTLTSNPSNGIAPYTYSWSGPNGFTSSVENPTFVTTLASAGVYSLIITDSCGATSIVQNTQSVTINPKIDTEFEGLNPGLCRFGTPPLLPNLSTNGITGTWNPATVNNTIAGTFSYTFTPDIGQCANVFVQTIFVVNNVTPNFLLPASICQGSTPPNLNTISNNGIVGTWNPSTISTTTSGSYTFTPNIGQCATIRTYSITVTPRTIPTFTLPASICENAVAPTLPATSNNGITGTWNPTTISNTTSGTYTFTHNPSQCATDTTITINVNPNITPTFNPIGPICENATAPALPSTSTNGITGTWNPTTISNTTSGTYNFTPTSGLCSLPTTLNVLVNPNITPTFDPIPNVCYQSTVPTLPLTSNNGITGTWNPAIISNTASGTYTFTPTTGLCAVTTTLSVTVDVITPTFNSIAPICVGDIAPVLQSTSNNGITGIWNPPTVSNTASGTYTFTPNANQCATSATINVIVNPIIAPTFTPITPICENETAPILQSTSNNGITGTWNPAIVSNTASGTYTFTPDTGQCSTTTTLNVIVNPNVTPTFNSIAPICEGTTAPILQSTSNNGYTGTWNPATISNTTSGTYTFTPDAGQCATTTTSDVIVNPNITPIFTIPTIICEGEAAPILPTTSNNGIIGSWNPATISNIISLTYVFTPNTGQCATTSNLSITVSPSIIPTFNPIPDVCYQSIAPTLQTTSNNGITGTWNPSTISNTTSGTYTFTPDTGQCATTASLSVTVTIVNPAFDAISPICYGTTAPTLPTTSNNGITGTWNPATIDNNASGTYTFTPDLGQCAPNAILNVTVTTITTTFNPIADVCYQSTAPILPTTSTNGITGTWNPTTISNTASGTYNFTPDANQCATPVSITINVITINPTFDTIAAICENAAAPTLPNTSNNGITGTWNPTTISDTSSGTYIFTPNSGQCATTASLNVIVNPTITPTFSPIADICYGNVAPTLPLTSNNGIIGTWNPATISNTASGTYTFTPSAGQCATTTSLNVTVIIITPTFNAIADVCYLSTAPTLQTTSNNGITGTWNPAIVSNTTSGNYTFTPDAGQCAPNVTITINVTTITPSFAVITPICENATAPILPLTSINGITGTWNPATISNTASGTYNFTPDANQCAISASLFVLVNPNVTPTFNTIAPICENATAQNLPLSSNNGITGTWNPATVSNTTSATYTFTPDAGLCAISTTLSITVNPNVTPTFNSIADVCYGTTAPVLPTTSTNGISGTWNPTIVSNTNSGTYNFTPNAGQCATLASITINVIIINPAFDSIAPICENATAPILPTTSNNGITGTWNPATVSNINSATYTFTPDAGQCATTTSLSVTVNPIITPVFNSIADICYGNVAPTLALTSNNGIIGTWNPATISNTASGTYTFTPDAGQCATTTSLNVTVIIITPIFNPIADVCYQSTAPTLQTTSNNGITGTWNPATVSNTTSGNYTFTPNAGQCAPDVTITINVTIITPSFSAVAPICENATAPILPITSNNGITGTWNPATVSNTTSATYTFTPDAGQCAINTTLTITVNPNVTPTFNAVANVCYGTTAPVLPTTSTNGITGTWNPATVSNTNSGTYNFTPNAGQCAIVTSLNINVNTVNPIFNTISPICYGTTSPILPTTSTNGITGTWNPATIDNTTNGTYTFTPDLGQCALSVTINTTINTIIPTFNSIPNVCYGSAAPTLPSTSNNGITGTWNPTTVSNTTSGTYTFTPTIGQCSPIATITINVSTITPIFAVINSICENATAPTLQTTSVNGITGSWNPTTISNTTSGTYTFTPDAGQCAITTTLSVTINPNITPTFNPIASICENATAPTLPLTSSNGITGTWNPVTVSNITSGNYTFTPDSGQCALSTNLNITVIPNVIPTFTAFAPICLGTPAPSLPLISNNGFSGTWSPSSISNSISGTYTFTPATGQCATSTTLNVTVNSSPTAITTLSNNVFNNIAQGTITITGVTGGNAPFTYSLNNGTFTSNTIFNNLTPGSYSIRVLDSNGCTYEEFVLIESNCMFPNGISPNGDGKNDTFNLSGCGVVKLELFNRYGTKINSYTNYTNQWDGTTSNGNELPDGTYFYAAELSDGTSKTGWVFIAR